MPGVEQLPRIIPMIVRLIPQLVRPTFYRGSAVVMNNVQPSTDEQLERELNRKIKRKKSDEAKDKQMVLKVSDALDCVAEKFNATTLVREFVERAVKDLISGQGEIAASQKLFDKIALCIREHALRQDTPRRKHRTSKYGRPAKGHGHGRGHF